MPIDPPYVGRVAGPMTRTVDDAALMMSVMAKPDRRDGMSLPPNDIHWKTLDKPSRKLRIGLLLDPGVGQALEKDVRDVVIKAAKAFEGAGAIVHDVKGILTREMLEGLDNFWRARLWDDLSKLPATERRKTLPYILNWAEAGAKLSGVDVIRGFNATMAIRAAAAKLFADIDYVISPVSPVVKFAAELAAPLNDPDRPFEHITYTVPWNMAENPAVSINGGYDARGFSDRRADHRPPLRRSRGARHGESVREPARRATAVAESSQVKSAEDVTSGVIPGLALTRHPGMTAIIFAASTHPGSAAGGRCRNTCRSCRGRSSASRTRRAP